jgi:diguanylate cyclase (GGDEF)-like protein
MHPIRLRRTRQSDSPTPGAVRVVRAVTGLALLVYAASTVWRPNHGWDWVFDSWVGNIAYGGATVLCAWRAVAIRLHRAAWSMIALSFALFTTGSILWTTTIQHWNPVPYPSPADVLWLIFYPVAYIGLALLIRDSLPRRSGVWLDGLIAALGFSAVVATVVLGPIAEGNSGNAATVLTNLAYPVGDLVLVTVLVAYFALRGWRVGSLWWALGSGFALFAFADSLYVWRVVRGVYTTGTPLDSLWAIAIFIVAVAALRDRTAATVEEHRTQPIAIPALFLLGSLAIIVYGTGSRVLPVGIGLATLTLVVAIVRLATSFRQLRSLVESRREARTDELTSLANRRPFYEAVTEWSDARRGEQIAVIMIDLARFKEINDSLGHGVGDEVLRQLGRRLAGAVRGQDVVARLGGDEFGIVLRRVADAGAAIQVAERVRRLVVEPFVVDSVTFHLDAGLGIAFGPQDAADGEALIHKADAAMYECKRRHLPWAVYSPGSDVDSTDRLALVEELRHAISNDELVVYYQPKLDLRTGVIGSAEALVRWQHPTRGLLAPDQFIALADQTGLIGKLTQVVLGQSLEQLARWRAAGHDLKLAVNLSASNLLDLALPSDVDAALQAHGIPPEAITLEITEDVLMFDPEEAGRVMQRLRALGCELSIDDYGTGFSSLAYLRDLPVAELKLDRSFVADVDADSRAVAIVGSTVGLAHSLGLRMVAEGVETQACLSVLRHLGCDEAQGYFIARPVPAADFSVLLEQAASQAA